jgi:hypothetical protein
MVREDKNGKDGEKRHTDEMNLDQLNFGSLAIMWF